MKLLEAGPSWYRRQSVPSPCGSIMPTYLPDEGPLLRNFFHHFN
ncbi:hypothetical protein [uncultured Arthrobacter sp.]|nr:hypothetical protein [uncultured Arthrobacter sp.]